MKALRRAKEERRMSIQTLPLLQTIGRAKRGVVKLIQTTMSVLSQKFSSSATRVSPVEQNHRMLGEKSISDKSLTNTFHVQVNFDELCCKQIRFFSHHTTSLLKPCGST